MTKAKAAAKPTKNRTSSKVEGRAKGALKATTKKDLILSLLRRKNGASIDELAGETEWQAHSVRGYLSGTIGKKLGLRVTSTKDPTGVRRYAIKH